MEAIGEVINSMKEHWILVLTLTIVVLIYLDYISNYTSLKKLGFKGPTPWPIFGHSMFLIFFGKTFHEYFVTARKKYGKIFGFYLLKTPTVVVMDPEILKSVMVKEFESFHDRPVIFLRFLCLHYEKLRSDFTVDIVLGKGTQNVTPNGLLLFVLLLENIDKSS